MHWTNCSAKLLLIVHRCSWFVQKEKEHSGVLFQRGDEGWDSLFRENIDAKAMNFLDILLIHIVKCPTRLYINKV